MTFDAPTLAGAAHGDAVFTLSVLPLRLLVRAAEARGVAVDELAQSAGVPREALQRRLGRLDSVQTVRLVAELERRLPAAPLALEATEALDPRELGLLGLVVNAAETLGDALRLGVRFFSLMHDSAELTVHLDDRFARVGLSSAVSPYAVPALVELTFAAVATLGRCLSQREVCALEVRFSHPERVYRRELELFFRAPVQFQAPRNELVFPAAYLDLPVPQGNASTKRLLSDVAARFLASATPEDELHRVRRALVRALRAGDASLPTVARSMGKSARTLQRRLQALGTTHQALLEDVRCSLALHDLAVPGVEVSAVAAGLGFADGSTFARAFRRWTQSSPSAARLGGAPVSARTPSCR